MKTILAFLLLIPSMSWGKEINLSCEKLYSELYEAGKLKQKKSGGQVVFVKIYNNKIYFNDDEYGVTIHKSTDDYYYLFDKKDSYWKNYLFDVLQGKDGGNNTQYRINRKTGIMEIWGNTSSVYKVGFKNFYQCNVVKNKF